MNDYIMTKLNDIHRMLAAPDHDSAIEQMENELEMIKMEIEQHIQNMPKTAAYRSLLASAEDAVEKLTEILAIWEELPCSDPHKQQESINEMRELIESIAY